MSPELGTSGGEALTFGDEAAYLDFGRFVRRAKSINDAGIHLLAHAGALVSYVSVVTPSGLLDNTPTVLGARVAPLGERIQLNRTVGLSALTDRLARAHPGTRSIELPPMDVRESWSGILPPKSGWREIGSISVDELESIARDGMEQVAQVVPEAAGAHLVNAARSHIWSQPIKPERWLAASGVESGAGGAYAPPALPSGAAFAAFMLGFLRVTGTARIMHEPAGNWLRASTPMGHVLVKASR